MQFREAVGTITDLNMLHALEFFTTALDINKSRKLMKDIMFIHPKDLSKAYNQTENFIAIDDVINSLGQQSRWSDKPRDRDIKPNAILN